MRGWDERRGGSMQASENERSGVCVNMSVSEREGINARPYRRLNR